ncbi:uncharacterized protein A1O9_12021 [Exophiala aquamarina CBS 119918]|uniref:FAS1 domain-containing protein n=1 Tax=Exophiala aquamarina CBS 119918 TaxID=1182545 RepID=A0A072NWN1_9EURO|nr:uncharacterized protein A1O9_12021 [Exophiala aquamarina CBS 119918]KEF52031.1 hypothetical protein A1O9_12021 [Exophiala aquamarina CBS 119918]
MLFKGLTLAALAGAAIAQEATPDLVTLLSNQTELSNLTSYLQLFPDFTGQLGGLQNITLLAPNNAAFANLLNSSAGAALTNGDQDMITALFSYHVINGTYANLSEAAFVPTLLQPPQFTNVTGGQVVSIFESDDVTTFVSGLLSTANLTGEPLNFTGGVVHIVDNVLLIPQNVSETATQLNLTAAAGALTNASLVDSVDYLEDVTIFVPNNEAFAAIGSALPNLTMEQLTAILTYHVINGTVAYSNMLENGTSYPTLQGNNVTVTIEDNGDVFVNSAKVVIPDVLVANGVVHVIDNVLNPENSTATAPADDSESGTPAFEGASSASDVPFTSGARQPTSTIATENAPQATSSSSSGLAAPLQTGAMGAAALFGGAAIFINNM